MARAFGRALLVLLACYHVLLEGIMVPVAPM